MTAEVWSAWDGFHMIYILTSLRVLRCVTKYRMRLLYKSDPIRFAPANRACVQQKRGVGGRCQNDSLRLAIPPCSEFVPWILDAVQ